MTSNKVKYYIYNFDIDAELQRVVEKKFAANGMTFDEGFNAYLKYAINHPDKLRQWVEEEKDQEPIIRKLIIYPVQEGQTDEEAKEEYLQSHR